ncbi:ThiF family adenylyltransferase [Nocardioides kribbensis]|uniref:ThiF family adenylyltransferase n=1 Tax=Nocardioides kribbensis TaxID=305517 RepID=A0ABV1NTE0_9ACTN
MKSRKTKTTVTTPASPAPRWQITDEALASLDRELATPAPERGAALLAPADTRLVVDVIVDPIPGEQVSYWHSLRLGELLNQRLADQPLLRYVGTAHSHPGGMAWPSLPDHQAFSASVAASGLETGLFPIVVATPTPALRMPEQYGAEHLVDLPHGTLAPYTWRTTHGLDACQMSVMPLRGSIDTALAELSPALTLTAGATVPVEGVGTAWLLVPLDGDTQLDLLVPQSYPESAPLIRCGEGGFASPAWDLSLELGSRLAEAIRAAASTAVRPADARDGIAARLSHHIPTAAADEAKRVAILGCGSVGSTIAELLVRAGVEAFTLVDPDEVSGANLSRGVYAAADIGRDKVDALADRLRAIAPHAMVTTHAAILGEDAPALLRGVDLAIMATDDPAAEAWHSHVLYDAGVPYVSAKLFAKADAGEVAFVVPEAGTACLACATGMTTVGGGSRGAVNYGTGRLDGEPALGADITAVSARATRTALALLHRDTPGPLAEWIAPLLDASRTLNLSCSVVGWGIFSHVALPPMDGPFASLWVNTAPQPACLVCGPDRVAPELPVAAVPAPDDLDALLAELDGLDEAGSVRMPQTPALERS